jgi:hypothetical protein
MLQRDERREISLFISHASEDKGGFVRPLAEALRQQPELDVWYDEYTLTSLPMSICELRIASRC